MHLHPAEVHGDRPLALQKSPDVPVVVGVGQGEDVLCPTCKQVVLLKNVVADSIYDLAIRCAGCGCDSHTPSFPPGRGLGGLAYAIPSGPYEVVESLVAELDQVIVSVPSAHQRQVETGRSRDQPQREAPRRLTLDLAGIEEVCEMARQVFALILPELEAQYARGKRDHRLPHLLVAIGENLADLQAGDREVDVLSVMELERDAAVFERWSRDPYFDRLLDESKTAKDFEHNVLLLTLATLFDDSGLGPELVPTGNGRSPDFRLRISARRSIEVEIKTPEPLQRRPQRSVPVKDAKKVVATAIRRSRGQFSTTSILVLGGSFWTGDFDDLADAARSALARPLPANATREARLYHQNLCGVILASTLVQYSRQRGTGPFEGRWDEVDWTHANAFRWIRNPIYEGDFEVAFAEDLSTFSLSFRPDGPASE